MKEEQKKELKKQKIIAETSYSKIKEIIEEIVKNLEEAEEEIKTQKFILETVNLKIKEIVRLINKVLEEN